MPLHLLKTAVGIRAVEHLEAVQRQRIVERDGSKLIPGFTRRRPIRAEAVEDGGSIFWIVQGMIACRQRVIALECDLDDEGLTYCRMMLDPTVVRTVPMPRKHMQGWRYLEASDAPDDLDAVAEMAGMPPKMMAELRALGLL